MSIDVQKWIKKEGKDFLREIGIKKDQYVLDFGCGEGHYTIPLAEVVGRKGKVYAFDKDRQALDKVKLMIAKEGLDNIDIIEGKTHLPLEDDSVDAVLCFDVVHYEKDRKKIYDEIHRVLKSKGLLFLYPKHYKEDYPLMELASLSLEDVIKEVENSGFTLEAKFSKVCLHDEYYNDCFILSFRKEN